MGEAAIAAVVVPENGIVETGFAVALVTGELPLIHRAGGIPVLAKGKVAGGSGGVAAGVGCDASGEMVVVAISGVAIRVQRRDNL